MCILIIIFTMKLLTKLFISILSDLHWWTFDWIREVHRWWMSFFKNRAICQHMHAYLASATIDYLLVWASDWARVCFHNAPVRSMWPVAIASSTYQRMCICVHQWTTLFIATISSGNLVNSIKCVSNPFSYTRSYYALLPVFIMSVHEVVKIVCISLSWSW